MVLYNNAQRFCWEQVHKINCVFRISHLFSPPQISDQLLALHALFASIELLNCGISEELIARRKLDWWRAELLEQGAENSHHPVVRYLHATGALKKLPESMLRLLLDSAEARFDAFAPVDEDDFIRLCQDIYRPQLLLELALEEADEALIPFRAAVLFNGGLIQLLRESGRRKENVLWWIPLSLLARFKVNRKELETYQDSEVLQALFGCILGLQEQSAVHQLPDRQPGLAKVARLEHLQLMTVLQTRQLDRLKGINPATYPRELSRWRVGDLMAAWKCARHLNKSSDY